MTCCAHRQQLGRLLKLSCNLAGESQLFDWLGSAQLHETKPMAWLSLKKKPGRLRWLDSWLAPAPGAAATLTWTSVCIAQLALVLFAQEFEMIYCQRLATCIHFIRPCLHSLVHLPQEVICVGPPICSSQWTLEHTIGNLTKEIKLHSNTWSNLS